MLKAKETRLSEFDETITLQSATQAVDAYGGPTVTFADIQTFLVKVEFAKTGSGEDYNNAVNLNTNRVIFTMHYRTDFDEKSRIVWNGRDYDILRIEMDGRRMYTVVTAEFKA